MADGKTHQRGYVLGLAALAAAGAYLLYEGSIGPDEAAGLLVGGVVGMLIDPDVRDQHNITTRGERRIWGVPLLGPIIGYVFQVYWYPLALLIPHRSFLSHLPVIATAIAAAWLILPPAAVVYYLNNWNLSLPFRDWLWMQYQPWVLPAFIGWCVQDAVHLALDGGKFTWQMFGRSVYSKGS